MLHPGLVFLAALVFSLVLVPVARRLSQSLGKVKLPAQDRWHRFPTPTLGGVAIFAAFFLAATLISWLAGTWSSLPWGLVAGAGLIFLVGCIDDLRPLSPPVKLGGQILAAAVVISLGYTTHFFSPRIANEILAQLPNILLTFLWLVGISNAINLLDNMDGLAGGIALITAGFLCYFFWQAGNQGLLWVSLALAGSLAGFLVYNFPPASIFMGDSGSLFLGFILAGLAIAREPQASNVFAVMGVPTLLFLLPILDTGLVTLTRLLRGQSPAQGGRDHTSHRLIAFGLSERQALLALYGAAILSGVAAAALESIQYWFSLVLVPLLVLSFGLLTAYLGGVKILPSSAPTPRARALGRIMLDLTLRGRLFEVILDFFLVGVAYYLAFLARYGRGMDAERLDLYLQSLPLALVGSYLSFILFRIYRAAWRALDFVDLGRYFLAAVGAAGIFAAVTYLGGVTRLVPWGLDYPLALYLLFGVFLLLILAASRSSFRIFDLAFQRRYRFPSSMSQQERVLIFGAGETGELILRWLRSHPELNLQPVGFLDEDAMLLGRQMLGLKVLGSLESLETVLDEHQVQGVLLAGGDEKSETTQLLQEACRRCGCWLRRAQLRLESLED